MAADSSFARWAALFVNACGAHGATDAAGDGAASRDDHRYAPLTQAAREVLCAVDAGGIPAFVTARLRQIACDNGIVVASQSTPNDIVASLRSLVKDSPSEG